jgi:hypothetical protein
MQPAVINVNHGSYHATVTTVEFDGRNQLLILIELNDRRMGFSLEDYPVVKEFSIMLKNRDLLERSGRRARQGEHFAAYTDPDDPTRAIGFRQKGKALMISFSLDEWRQLGELLDKALALPEVQDLFEQFI